jgi:hypothetical protein
MSSCMLSRLHEPNISMPCKTCRAPVSLTRDEAQRSGRVYQRQSRCLARHGVVGLEHDRLEQLVDALVSGGHGAEADSCAHGQGQRRCEQLASARTQAGAMLDDLVVGLQRLEQVGHLGLAVGGVDQAQRVQRAALLERRARGARARAGGRQVRLRAMSRLAWRQTEAGAGRQTRLQDLGALLAVALMHHAKAGRGGELGPVGGLAQPVRRRMSQLRGAALLHAGLTTPSRRAGRRQPWCRTGTWRVP